MTSEPTLNQNGTCNCEGNCCLPPRKPLWHKVVFSIVILAALAIIAVKLVSGPEPAMPGQAAQGCNTAGADSSGVACDSTKGSSCCPK